MQNRIIGNRPLTERPYLELQVELLPETEQEKQTIRNCENLAARDEERDMVNDYLLFGIQGNYSIVEVIAQKGNFFSLKAARV